MSYSAGDNPNKILSILAKINPYAASLTAVFALAVSVYAGYLTRQHDRLSVKPILQIGANTAPAPVYGLILSNEGAGPALVKGWKIIYKNEVMGEYQEGNGLKKWHNIEKGWLKIRNQLGISPDLIACSGYAVYRSGQTSPIFWVTQDVWNNNKKFSDQDRQKFQEALKEIIVEIDYESIYKERDHCHFSLGPQAGEN